MLDLHNKTILVTGGCGFIGSNFIEMILKNYENLRVVNIDKMGVGSRTLKNMDWSSIGKNNQYMEIEEDVRNIDKIIFGSSFISFDYLFHFAAESHVDRSISSPKYFVENNVMGMMSLLEYIRNTQREIRIINVSTDEVYGHLSIGDTPFNECSKFQPRSPYSASKSSADLIANSYVSTYGLDIITTHCCNNFGNHQWDEKFIPTIVRNIINNNRIPLYGDGKNIREWIHVDDHNKSLLEITKIGVSGQRYNIGSSVEKSNLDMIRDIGNILGVDPDIEFVEDRKGHDFRYAVKSLHYMRNFKTRDHFDALKETVNFYKEKYENKRIY